MKNSTPMKFCFFLAIIVAIGFASRGVDAEDRLAKSQETAIEEGRADWGHWGVNEGKYSSWTSHSNRLIPIYTFGLTLEQLRRAGSPYGDSKRLAGLYGRVPRATLRPEAKYFDQTQIRTLQEQAVASGKKYIVLIVFDGMDWQTTQAAAVYRSKVWYESGRGSGLAFQDYRGTKTDYGYMVTSPYAKGATVDVNAQVVQELSETRGGYDPDRGGWMPWAKPLEPEYLLGKSRELPHAVTDSASSATSMTSGIKSFNGSINVAHDGRQVEPIARWLQRTRGFRIGVVTSVPISHATPAAAYANNVSRGDYQDLTRDLLGLSSISHRSEPLAGVDVLIGGGWGEQNARDTGQGSNYVPGNRYLAAADLAATSIENGGKYRVATRTKGRAGRTVLAAQAKLAAEAGDRLFGFFGVRGGHLPYQTADGGFNPARDVRGTEKYRLADVEENPTLAESTRAALQVLGRDRKPFWLMVEAGDVDWANHANNLDSSIGAVLSGDRAFREVASWAESHQAWDEPAVIVTADHGHFFVLTDARVLIGQ